MTGGRLMAWLAFGLAAGVAQAAGTADLDKCISTKPSTGEISMCLFAIHKKEDGRLNTLYKKAMVRAQAADAAVAEELRKSQRAWVTMRDGWCNFQALWEGGTAARIAQPYCLALTTRKRNEDLAFYAGQAAAPAPIWKQ